MRIGHYSGYATARLSSGAQNIGGVTLPKFGDFHYPTKTKAAMSDDKFKEAIIEQAKKDFAMGKYQNNAEARNLQKQYVSVVSPDRKSIITNGLTAIAKKPPTKTIDFLSLLLLGEVRYQKSSEGVSYAEFYDSNGEMVATYSNNGWSFFGTKAENARETEFNLIYSKAWRNASEAAQSPNNPAVSTVSPSSIEEVTFEAKA